MYNYIEKFEEILNEFDFNKVKQVMDYLEWTWYDTDGVPNIKEMKNSCWRLFEHVLSRYLNSKSKCIISSGGFKITLFKEYILLEFIVAELDTEYF